METKVILTEADIDKEEPVTLVSPKNPTPLETVFLSNIDQTLAFPVSTVFFFKVPHFMKITSTLDVAERVKKSVSEVLLIPYYFMAGRLNFNCEASRLELVCNNAGVLFVTATSELALKDLGDLRLPNPSFHHLIHRVERSKDFIKTPIFTIQVTRFKCGGFSIGFVVNHSLLDGRAAAEMFDNLATLCRGEGMKICAINNDRTFTKARVPPQIKFPHKEYIKLSEISSTCSSFAPPSSPHVVLQSYTCKLISFTPEMLSTLKDKALTKCSTFEAIVAHLWRTRTKAVFNDPNEDSSVMFAVDIRSRMSPPLPHGFSGNAVVTASATAKVAELDEKPFAYCVEKIKESNKGITDEYVRSVIDWLEVYKGVPCTSVSGNFYVSAWWKLPFYELDFGFGKPIYGGPVMGGFDDFVLLLSDGNSNSGGINVWICLEHEKMERFMVHVFDI
ncbi:omega-hydroxypalmitate O-feruloyl transferase-like [Thalictrum thalictroides]|uniref:Omega-hydroxypalmitate O-feruloyl transferase-like n=1 Tax=Thalictrum thalictroides TaxID=46969 RepID=A0A7J6UXM1_THATH|nr:omega-hydroxypalmitate O-feruloyl transferase-like [Thalictrum thalictroides]